MGAFFKHEEEFFYRNEAGEDIYLNDTNYIGLEHRLPEHRQVDMIMITEVDDGADLHLFRFDQERQDFVIMMELAKRIGTFVLRDTPYKFVQELFDQEHQLTEHEIDDLLEEGDHDPS